MGHTGPVTGSLYIYLYTPKALGDLTLTNVFSGSKHCLTLLETVGLRVRNRNFRGFSLFIADFKRGNCPFARYASAANPIDSDSDISNRGSVSVNTNG